MGCDIHMFAEIRKNNKWEKVGKIFPNPYHDPERENKVDEDGYEWNPKYIESPYRGRNYDLFAILADVRNGRGFAGIKTGEGFNPIADPKGLPNDVSVEILQISEDYGVDGHSHSFLTIQELEEYDWTQHTMLRGTVSLEQYRNLQKTGGNPGNYCGMISGHNVVTVEENVADLCLKGQIPAEIQGKEIHVNYHWMETYKDAAGERFFETINVLKGLGNPDDVRIVFFFDN